MKALCLSIVIIFYHVAQAQNNAVSGMVEDAITHEILVGASITLFRSSGILGAISNAEGKFSINNPEKIDSVKFSMIGYRSKVYKMITVNNDRFFTAALYPAPSMLQEVVVHPLDALEIIRQAAQKIPAEIPPKDFESNMFYREIIRDSLQYYSVAEAIFDAQFSVQKKSFKLRLDKGRSKEDVAYTRLFEDFHPGGGPEDAIGQSFAIRRPDFLHESSIKNYIYKKDSTIRLDDEIIYVISFDQKSGLTEALEKGQVYIDAGDFSVLKFDAANSPKGSRYIKSLKGTDKLFAELLHIDLTVKGWSRTAAYTKIGSGLFLSYAKMSYDINYKQPKKSIDLALQINTELLVTDFQHPIVKEIAKGEEWKRKNLVANLPTDFDAGFWGASNILSPTTEIKSIIDSLSKKNNDNVSNDHMDGWQYLNKNFFTAVKDADSILMVPLAKCSWEDNETGGMIYKNMAGDFSIETKLTITKRSNRLQEPDNGFQQCGIIVRGISGNDENHIIFSLGTGGNDIPKYFLKRTSSGKTKSLVEKTNTLTGWLRIERHGSLLTVFKKTDEKGDWLKVDSYELGWLKGEVAAGFSIMARFAGAGPKQRPDMRAVFSAIKIMNQ